MKLISAQVVGVTVRSSLPRRPSLSPPQSFLGPTEEHIRSHSALLPSARFLGLFPQRLRTRVPRVEIDSGWDLSWGRSSQQGRAIFCLSSMMRLLPVSPGGCCGRTSSPVRQLGLSLLARRQSCDLEPSRSPSGSTSQYSCFVSAEVGEEWE